MVASTSSDGTVALTLYNNGHWQESIRVSNNANKIAHAMGATAVSFAPYRLSMNECMLFASGGCDCKVRFWTTTVTDRGVIGAVTPTYCLEYHTGWVHDVSFCPASSSLPYLLFSSCGRDKKVCIYRKSWEQIEDDMSRGTFTEWERSEFIVDEGCWKLSWAPSSEKLLVTSSSGAVFMFTEGEDFHEKWLKVCVKE
ncbi:protein transport protein SEC13 [Angomonas deanei]|nr:protein transport protein SEC13 [Angomonas deanei]|eukprot:EPY40162.1 protein transport protein SEC13 [Angomonas deanei]